MTAKFWGCMKEAWLGCSQCESALSFSVPFSELLFFHGGIVHSHPLALKESYPALLG